MNHYTAALYVSRFGYDEAKLAEVYDAYAELRAALSTLISGFEYPDFSFMTMNELRCYLNDLVVPVPATLPDFDAVRDKRMSELTPEQRNDAHELWIRENVGWMGEYHLPKYTFLLKRLDEARATKAAPAKTSNDAGLVYLHDLNDLLDESGLTGEAREKLKSRLLAARAEAPGPANIGAEILPGATAMEIMSVAMHSIVGDYDVPDLPECDWVRDNASFSHVNAPWTWEYVLNLANDFPDIPEKLKPVLEKARANDMAYVVFHQGI
ncbi:hypothetical protein G3A43_07010 [Paraburkholderia aspalathi]|nr:hypothetical protein [Paraburkholderia aspalathi]MBK3780001.1 hypothetical protein [Paraburkholderia aspalathi]